MSNGGAYGGADYGCAPDDRSDGCCAETRRGGKSSWLTGGVAGCLAGSGCVGQASCLACRVAGGIPGGCLCFACGTRGAAANQCCQPVRQADLRLLG